MKNVILILLAAIVVSCGNKQQSQQQECDSINVASDTVVQQMKSQVNKQELIDSKVIEKIQEFYKTYVFGDKAVNDEIINSYCTKKLVKKLAADCDYDDGGYAIWDFRSDNQDGDSNVQEVTNIESLGNNMFKVSYNDMGFNGSCKIRVVIEGENILFDEIIK